MNNTKQQVLVVGGGFGGIKTALELAEDERFEVTLLSDHPNFRYYPTLYRTATGGSRTNSTIPLTELFKDSGVKLEQGSAVSIDRKARTVALADGRQIPYGTLVLSLGVVTNYFGIPGMQEFSYSIKSIEEIDRFKQHLHQQLADDRRPDLNYVIVGAGPTGIELAGELPEYLRKITENHGIKQKSFHVDLIEAAPRLLPRMPEATSKLVARRLKKVGVKLFVNRVVQGVSADNLMINGKPLRSHTVIWTAGVTNHPFFKENGFLMTPRGKVVTDMYLQAEDNIYVIGDNANTPYSGMAQTALHDGIFVSKVIKARASGEDPKGYDVKKPVTVIPVGERWAVVLWGKLRLNGIIGWALRESADLAAFVDYQPWWKAGKQWLTGFETEESCEVCRAAQQRAMVDK